MGHSIVENFKVNAKDLAKNAKLLKKYLIGDNYYLVFANGNLYMVPYGSCGVFAKLLNFSIEFSKEVYFSITKEDIAKFSKSEIINFSMQTKDNNYILELSSDTEQVFLDGLVSNINITKLLNNNSNDFILLNREELEKIANLANKLITDTCISASISIKSDNTKVLGVTIQVYDEYAEYENKKTVRTKKTVLNVLQNNYESVDFTINIFSLNEALKKTKDTFLVIQIVDHIMSIRGMAKEKIFWIAKHLTMKELHNKIKKMDNNPVSA